MITSALAVGFSYSFAYVLIGGIGYAIALKIVSSGLGFWRSVAELALFGAEYRKAAVQVHAKAKQELQRPGLQ
jgi:hypothetical protein